MDMRIPATILFQIVVLSMLAGCGGGAAFPFSGVETGSTNMSSPKTLPGLPAGFECPLVPSGVDPVGSIFRLDKNGTYFRVANPPNDPEVQKGINRNMAVGDYVYSDRQKSSADLSFSLLKRALPGLSASAKADFNKEVLIGITVKDLKSDVVLDSAADRIKDLFIKNHKPKRSSRYFLVRESYLAGSVRYDLSYADLKKVGGAAKVAELADASAEVNINKGSGRIEIDQKFDPRIQVCIKVAEIEIDSPRSRSVSSRAAKKVSLKSTDDTLLPTVKHVSE